MVIASAHLFAHIMAKLMYAKFNSVMCIHLQGHLKQNCVPLPSDCCIVMVSNWQKHERKHK